MNLAEALPAEQARCRRILDYVMELPVESRFFMEACLKADLAAAEKAAAAGDLAGMIVAYQALKEYKE